MTRADTLLFALLVLNVLLGTVCVAVAKGEGRTRGLRQWGWGLIVYSAGILITIPPFVPYALRKILGNVLIAYAPILTTEGALAYTDVRLNRPLILSLFAATLLPIVYNYLGPSYHVLIDFLAPAVIANVLFLFAAVVLIRRPPPDAVVAARFVGGLFVYNVLVWTLRAYALIMTIGHTNDRDRADLAIAMFSIAQMVAAVASTLGLLWIEVRNMEAELRRLANDDALTGLPNRRVTVARFAEEAIRAARHRRAFALLLLDVDHFKRINDTHGHLAGDGVLRHVAAVLRGNARDTDIVGRIGGEEFVVILGEQALDGALSAATRLRETVAASPARHDRFEVQVTVSGGLAMYPNDGFTWDEVFSEADRRLYVAKAAGRDRIQGPVTVPPAGV